MSHIGIIHEKNCHELYTKKRCQQCQQYIFVSSMSAHRKKCASKDIPINTTFQDCSGAETSDIPSSQISVISEDESFDTSDVLDDQELVKLEPIVQHNIPQTKLLQKVVSESEQSSYGSSVTDGSIDCIEDVAPNARRCTQCDQKFKSNAELKRHITQNHVKNLSFIVFAEMSCSICKTTYSKISKLEKHIEETHKLDPATGVDITQAKDKHLKSKHFCEICKEQFSNKGSMRHHMRNFHGSHNDPSTLFSCSFCSASFVQEDSMKCHMKKMHKKDKYMDGSWCLICNTKFDTFAIYEHLRRIHQIDARTGLDISGEMMEKSFCKFCKINLLDHRKMQSHMETVHQKKFSCDICSAPFTLERALYNHKVVSHETEDGKKSLAENHLMKHHEPKPDSLWCDMCQKKSQSRRAFLNHTIKVHASFDEKNAPFSCNKCPAIFVSEYYLFRHVDRLHKDDVPTKLKSRKLPAKPNDSCAVCQKTFHKSLKSLKKHNMRVHGNFDEEEAPFVCNLCPGMFVRDFKLSMHKTDVHGIPDNRYFECHICKKQYNSVKRVHFHVSRAHEIDPSETHKKYRVIEADEVLDGGQRGLHSSNPNGSKMAPSRWCDICKQKFKQQKGFDNHMKSFHGLQDPIKAPFTCELCPGIFTKEHLVLRHTILQHNPDKDLIKSSEKSDSYCTMCKISFAQCNSLHGHIKKIHGTFNPKKAPHSCDLCHAIFVRNMQLAQHKTDVHGIADNRYFECLTCKKQCNNIKSIHYHVVRHHQTHQDDADTAYQIIEADEVVAAKIDEDKIGSGNVKLTPSHWCNMCQKEFNCSAVLKNHTKKIHGCSDPAKAPFACDKCPAIFVKEHALIRHVKELHLPVGDTMSCAAPDPSDPTCTMCQRTFHSISVLNCHIKKIHGGFNKAKAPFSCDLCPAIFVRDMTLSKHKKDVHDVTDDRYFECLICNKQFNNARATYYHVHRGHKISQEDSHAQYRVINEDELKINVLALNAQGSGDDTYCNLCKRSFATRATLWIHMEAQHDPSTASFTCELCPAAFVSSARLQVHRADVHDLQSVKKEEYEEIENNDEFDSLPSKSESRCNMCEKSYYNNVSFRQHMEKVHGFGDASKATYKCESCPALFVTASTLAKHRSKLHDIIAVGLYECKVCNEQYEELHKIRNHVSATHCIKKSQIVNNYRVEKIPEFKKFSEFNNETGNNDTLNEVTEAGEFAVHSQSARLPCPICTKTLSRYNLDRHMIHVHKCSRAEIKKLLSAHWRKPVKRKIDKQEKPAPAEPLEPSQVFICSICDVAQSSYRMLKRHLHIMHKHLAIIPIMDLPTINEDHNRSNDGLPITSFYCMDCDDTLSSLSAFEGHPCFMADRQLRPLGVRSLTINVSNTVPVRYIKNYHHYRR